LGDVNCPPELHIRLNGMIGVHLGRFISDLQL
jgi:hypothetical protein